MLLLPWSLLLFNQWIFSIIPTTYLWEKCSSWETANFNKFLYTYKAVQFYLVFLHYSKNLMMHFYLIVFFGFGFIYFQALTIFLIIFLIDPQYLFFKLFSDLPGISLLINTHLAPCSSIFLNNMRSSYQVHPQILGLSELNLTKLTYLSRHCFPVLQESRYLEFMIQLIIFQLVIFYYYFSVLRNFYSYKDQPNLEFIWRFWLQQIFQYYKNTQIRKFILTYIVYSDVNLISRYNRVYILRRLILPFRYFLDTMSILACTIVLQ